MLRCGQNASSIAGGRKIAGFCFLKYRARRKEGPEILEKKTRIFLPPAILLARIKSFQKVQYLQIANIK